MTNYQRTVHELREVTSLTLPGELSQEAIQSSIMLLLRETQDKFIAILKVALRSPDSYFNLLNVATLSPNLFLKHLMILTDFDIGTLKRVNDCFRYLFPKGCIEYEWQSKIYLHRFQSFPIAELNDSSLKISNRDLAQRQPLNGLMLDAIILLLFGSACTDPETAEKLSQCKIGTYLGQSKIVDEFANKRYIDLSRMMDGIKFNSLTSAHLILGDEVGAGSEHEASKEHLADEM